MLGMKTDKQHAMISAKITWYKLTMVDYGRLVKQRYLFYIISMLVYRWGVNEYY